MRLLIQCAPAIENRFSEKNSINRIKLELNIKKDLDKVEIEAKNIRNQRSISFLCK